jgi:DNA-binding NtrC family response regulator
MNWYHDTENEPVILIIDDEFSLVRALERKLHRRGFLVEGTSNPSKLPILLKDPSIKCVITDYMMPGFTGDRVLELVQKQRPDVAVIVMTAYGTAENVMRVARAGNPVRMLLKPWEEGDLIDAIRDALDPL